MPQKTAAQYAAAMENSLKSTGPKTEAGKAISSQNAVKHGLSARFQVQPWEDAEEYNNLYCSFFSVFPAHNGVEQELLDSLVQSRWLARRAILLQEYCFSLELPHCIRPEMLALYLRYQTIHERAFHKAHAELLKLKNEREKERLSFVSQKRQEAQKAAEETRREAGETRKQELHQATLRLKNTHIRLKEARATHLEALIAAKNHPENPSNALQIAA